MQEHIEQTASRFPADYVVVNEQYYILARSSLADERARVLKHNETFAVFNRNGDIRTIGLGEQGLFHEGMRFLSRLVLRLGHERKLLLGSSFAQSNLIFKVDLMNSDFVEDGKLVVPGGTVHVSRRKFLWDGRFYEHLEISNFGQEALRVPLIVEFDADFVDIFEVRGTTRHSKGEVHKRVVDEHSVEISYTGLDRIERRTVASCIPAPDYITTRSFGFLPALKPQESREFDICYTCSVGSRRPQTIPRASAEMKAIENFRGRCGVECTIETDNPDFNRWLRASSSDLRLLLSSTEHGEYPYAGVPWYSCPFGRDGIITALQCLWTSPRVAKSVLNFLASTQAKKSDDVHEAEPGKIIHEMRLGEMAALGEIPFSKYYGTIDATPLFVKLAGKYFERTADTEFLFKIWNNVKAAIKWIIEFGDFDHDGFVEYQRKTSSGLINQGWKDSHDSVLHEDGELAVAPIALCEVQGYVFDAFVQGAFIAQELGARELAEEWRLRAEELQRRFEKFFWCEEIDTYALALDGMKQPCRVVSSNPGHCLYSGIASASRARRVAKTLMSEGMYSGWGVRTLSSKEKRFNPMSYHNGSVWPHDNALIAAGLARYGFKAEALRIFSDLFDAAIFFEENRLPELFSGFARSHDVSPTIYPVACSPQAWAVGSVYMLLAASLGLTIKAPGRIEFYHPRLPDWLNRVSIRELAVGDGKVDFVCLRNGDEVDIDIVDKKGAIDLIIIK